MTHVDLNSRFGRRRFAEFQEALCARPGTSILGLGGLPETWLGTGLEADVTLMNLNRPPEGSAPFRWLAGDARELPHIADGPLAGLTKSLVAVRR